MAQTRHREGACRKPLRSFFSVFFPLLISFILSPSLKDESRPPNQIDGMHEVSAGVFLVADPKVVDPNFSRTVVLLLQHDQAGSLGLIINRRTTIPLSQLLPDASAYVNPSEHLFRGGPVSRETLTFLFRAKTPPKPMDPIFQDVYGSREARVLADQLKNLAQKGAYRLYAGYAGWRSGQLQAEIARGDWSVAPADATLLFEWPPHQIWQEMFDRRQQRFVEGSVLGNAFTS